MKATVYASSATKEGLEKLINEFYYSKNYIITEDMRIYNTKTGKTIDSMAVRQTRGKWQFVKEA